MVDVRRVKGKERGIKLKVTSFQSIVLHLTVVGIVDTLPITMSGTTVSYICSSSVYTVYTVIATLSLKQWND